MAPPPKRPPPPESIMLPILLAVAAVAVTAVAIPSAAATPSPGGKGWLPWFLLGLGLAGLALAIFDRNPTIDFKASAKANAMILLFGPVGARIAYALVGGAFLGGGIGLFVA